MTKSDLSRDEQNPEVGLYIAKSGVISSGALVADVKIGRLCNWIKALTAGTVVYQDVAGGGDPSVWELEAGETAPLLYDTILLSANIDGTPYSTTVIGLYWGVSPRQISKTPSYS